MLVLNLQAVSFHAKGVNERLYARLHAEIKMLVSDVKTLPIDRAHRHGKPVWILIAKLWNVIGTPATGHIQLDIIEKLLASGREARPVWDREPISNCLRVGQGGTSYAS